MAAPDSSSHGAVDRGQRALRPQRSCHQNQGHGHRRCEERRGPKFQPTRYLPNHIASCSMHRFRCAVARMRQLVPEPTYTSRICLKTVIQGNPTLTPVSAKAVSSCRVVCAGYHARGRRRSGNWRGSELAAFRSIGVQINGSFVMLDQQRHLHALRRERHLPQPHAGRIENRRCRSPPR